MKEKIVKALINAAIGVLTSIATIYLGASATEVVTASGVTTGAIGGRAADFLTSLLA